VPEGTGEERIMSIIHFLANDGSPLGVTENSIEGLDGRSGCGGAELFLLTLCRGLHDRGHQVTVYNDAVAGSVFAHATLETFRPKAERDYLIIFRSPNERINNPRTAGKKIFLSCDQYTVGDFREFAEKVDQVVCISPNHANYFKNMYGIYDTTVIDIPIRTWEYEKVEKKKNSCIFTSVPDRGLLELRPIWDRIVQEVPDATLTITSDWSLWSGHDMSNIVSPFRRAWAGAKNVNYVGAVKRSDLVRIQSEAEFHLYPNKYDELFGIAVAESQVAGAIPITSTIGALETTNRFGYKIDGYPTNASFIDKFVEVTVGLMKSERPLPDISENAKAEFDLQKILDKWEAEVFNG
jgi:glycosyltransferase involved in cell wall biosynthesis